MARFAEFDSTASAPAPVLGWYDTGEADYPSLPSGADLLEMTDDQWDGRFVGEWAVSDRTLVSFVPPPPPAQPALPWLVSKLVIVNRLGALSKLRAARAALKLGVADASLTDAQLLLRDRWDAATDISSDDQDVIEVLTAIGCDAGAVLAIE